MEAGSEPSVRLSGLGVVLFSLVLGGLLFGAMFAGDGSDVGGILPVGGAAVACLAAAVVLVAIGRIPAPVVGRSGAALVAALVGLTVWIGVTMSWSIVADRSWDAFNKATAYCAFLGLGIMLATAARGHGARLAGWILSVVLGVTLAWALVAKAVPSLDPDGDRVARLREPVGYWNALALLADVAVVLGLWLASERSHRRAARVLGAVLVYVATLALMLTLSRTGVVVGVAVVALWLVVGGERLSSGLVLAAAAAPAVLVGAWAFTRPALTEDVALRSDRVADGAVFGALALAGAAVVAVLVAIGLGRSLEPGTRRRLGRALVVLSVAGILAAGVAVSVSAADAVGSSRDCREVVNDPSRLGSLDSSRLCWWEEALDVYAFHGVEGAGAGSFEVARKRFREDARNVVQPHSVPLQQLADGGVVGIALFGLVILAGGAVCVCALRRLAGAERAAAAALVAAPAAYAVHSLVDYNWDFLAVTAPTAVALGALAGAGRAAGVKRTRPVLAVGTVLVAAIVLASFSFPRLADRELRASTRQLVAGDTERARDHALWAQVVFSPLSAEPYLALARVAERQGRVLRAEREYINAVEQQPENPETWYAAGIFEFEVRDNMCAAYRYLNEAYTRDPVGNQWVDDGPLDVSRDAVNAGGCAPGS